MAESCGFGGEERKKENQTHFGAINLPNMEQFTLSMANEL